MTAGLHPLLAGRALEIAIEWRGRALSARPLSAEAVIRYEAAITRDPSPAAVAAAKLILLRKAFPIRWRALWAGDVARQMAKAPAEADAALAPLFRLEPWPTRAESEPEPDDEWTALARANRDPYEAQERAAAVNAAPKMTLALAAFQVEFFLGARWYHDPERWPTVDGFAPVQMVWSAHRAMSTVFALERIATLGAYYDRRAKDPTELNRRLLEGAFHG